MTERHNNSAKTSDTICPDKEGDIYSNINPWRNNDLVISRMASNSNDKTEEKYTKYIKTCSLSNIL